MPKKHNRKLGLLGAALTTARIPRFSLEVMSKVRDKIETAMLESGFLATAPFEWVTVSLRYGLKNEHEPHYEPISKDSGDLPLAIELDTQELRTCTRNELEKAFETATLKALLHAGRKFNLECSALETLSKNSMSE